MINPYLSKLASNRFAKLFLPGLLVSFLQITTSHALTFNVTYDASVTNFTQAAQVEGAFSNATQILQTLYTNPITVNITVYWGAFGPFVGDNVSLGESETPFVGSSGFKYPQLTNALRAARTTAADSNSVASLPASDPTGGGQTWFLPRAQAKALGVLGISATDPTLDGSIAFATNVSYTFDVNNRTVSGKFDLIGVAEHEITEILGRNCGLNFFLVGGYVPYDLFRFTNGARTFDPNSTNVYFSVDNGATALKFYYTNFNFGDIQDWLTTPEDAYDAFAFSGHELNLSSADMTALDILGYKMNYHTPTLAGSKSGGAFQLNFTNTPGATFAILASTNISTTFSNWTVLGTNSEISAGHFQFTDSVTNKQRFYRVRLQ